MNLLSLHFAMKELDWWPCICLKFLIVQIPSRWTAISMKQKHRHNQQAITIQLMCDDLYVFHMQKGGISQSP